MLSVEVANQTEIFTDLSVSVVGFRPDGVKARPEIMALNPGEAGGFSVTGSLPSTFPPGTHTFGIRVSAADEPSLTHFTEFDLVVPDMSGLRLTLNPATQERIRFKSKLFLRNESPELLDIELEGYDPEGQLHFSFEPSRLAIPPGEDRLVRVWIRGRTKLLGIATRRSFTVTAQGPGQRKQVTGTFIQRPVIPRRIVQFLVIGVIAVALIFALKETIIPWVVDDEKVVVDETPGDGTPTTTIDTPTTTIDPSSS